MACWCLLRGGGRCGACWPVRCWPSSVCRGRRLAALMFGGADDPLGALRWELAQVRRSLGLPAALRVIRSGLSFLRGHGWMSWR
jgi:hypothetical protein